MRATSVASGEFELGGTYQVGFGGQGGVPARIEMRSADGSLAWSTSVSSIGAGLHSVTGGVAQGVHTMTVVPQPATADTSSWQMLVVVLPT